MDFTLRLEQPEDYLEVEQLTYKAFINLDKPGRERCDEHLLAHKLRDAPAFVPELDYVAVKDGKIIGNIMYSKGKVADTMGAEHDTVLFGPVSVLPEFQGQGIGSALIHHTMTLARDLGYPAIIIFGHPGYYARFGFRNAQEFGITTADGENFDAFMALELYDGALADICGKFYCDPVFELDAEELAEFEKGFCHG